ncbi:MAG: CHASE1-domain containing sensor protein [Alteromonadaceae bacterium]|jgi:CHASE1-domain containing sensor protein
MNLSKSATRGVYSGLIAAVIGLIAFTLSWNLLAFFEGPLPGYQVFLFPGNITLIFFWHPLFTEEINFWPKLLMLLFGQFVVVTGVVTLIIRITNRLRRKAS